MPVPLAITYCTRADIESILSVEGVSLRLDDENSGSETAIETANLAIQGIQWATSKINDFCQGRYDDNQMVQSWTVNEWCAVLATHWLCRRRVNGVPKSLETARKEVLAELLDTREGTYRIQGIPQRVTGQPAWSNMRVDHRYRLRLLRKEVPISEQTPNLDGALTQPDRIADVTVEY